MRVLDLFCGAGGAAMGLMMAFGDVLIVGVDIEDQPHYPFELIENDVFSYPWWLQKWDFIWASPKCQRHSTMTKRWRRQNQHEDQIAKTRELIVRTGIPYVIENVPAAPLLNPITLCGSMFGLGVRRHRKFECSFPIIAPECRHDLQSEVVGVYGHAGGTSKRDGLSFKGLTLGAKR